MTKKPRTDPNQKRWTLFAVCLGTFMLLLDVTVVIVALDSIEADLGASFADLQWVVDAYALGLAALLLTFGSISDNFGRRRMFIIGIAGFTIASLACALATSPLMLNIARGIQGIGAAAMFATALALLAQEFHGKDRGTAFGVWGATTGGAVAIGPLIGGALTDSLGWEWIFLVNIPLGLLTVAITLWKVPSHKPVQRPIRVDFAGLVTFSAGLFLLIFGLVRGNIDGWDSTPIVLCLAGSAALLVTFVIIELRIREPMLDMTLFKNPTFVGASVAAFALSASVFSLFLYITLYMQNVLGYGPFETGVRLLAQTILTFVIAAAAGKASAHVSVKGLMGSGLLCIGLGLAWMGFNITETSTFSALLPGLMLSGFGIGLTNPPLASAAVSVVPVERSGMAGGINSTFRQVGIAAGVACLGVIFQHQVQERVQSSLLNTLEPGDALRVAQSVTNGTADSGLGTMSLAVREIAAQAIRNGYVQGLHTILFVATAIALTASFIVFVTVRKKDFVSGGHSVR